MTRYVISQRFRNDRLESPGFLEHVERDLKVLLGKELVKQIPLDEPTMVRILRDEQPTYEPFAKDAPAWMCDPVTEIRYLLELRACQSMDTIVPRFIEPEPEIRYVDRDVPFPVYVTIKKPTFGQRIASLFTELVKPVVYDGGYE